MTHRAAILISGRGSNMSALLGHHASGALSMEPVVVFADAADAPGLATARAAGVPTACVPSRGRRRRSFDRALVEALAPYEPDVLILAGFMRILTEVVIQRWPGRIINIHPADARAYQGAHGYEWAWEQGLQETLITVHLVDQGMDTGPILAQAPVDLRGAADLDEVKRRGLAVEHRFLSEVLERVHRGDLDLDALWARENPSRKLAERGEV